MRQCHVVPYLKLPEQWSFEKNTVPENWKASGQDGPRETKYYTRMDTLLHLALDKGYSDAWSAQQARCLARYMIAPVNLAQANRKSIALGNQAVLYCEGARQGARKGAPRCAALSLC